MKQLIKDKSGKAKEITLGGCIILIIAGILFISASGSDSTGIMLPIGIIFVVAGVVGLIAIFFSFFKK